MATLASRQTEEMRSIDIEKHFRHLQEQTYWSCSALESGLPLGNGTLATTTTKKCILIRRGENQTPSQ